MKKDIFHGKIKKEYFSYILIHLIFVALLMFVVGGMVLGVGIWANAGPIIAIISMRILGVAIIALGSSYVVGCMLVIRKYPKYKKLRRILYNSDCYFTGSTSNEYYGSSRTLRGRRNKAAFEIVTAIAEAEKGMGDKRPVRYTVYSASALIMALFGLVDFIVIPLLYENGAIFSNMSQNVFLFCYISVGFVCIALAILFLSLAFKVGIRGIIKNDKWKDELYTSLIDISVRKNSKKHKLWYDADQLEKIESLVSAASDNAIINVERKSDRLISFTVVDAENSNIVFTGFFI